MVHSLDGVPFGFVPFLADIFCFSSTCPVIQMVAFLRRTAGTPLLAPPHIGVLMILISALAITVRLNKT